MVCWWGEDPIESTFTEKGCIDANYTLTKFSMDGFYCKECKKMIFNTDIKKWWFENRNSFKHTIHVCIL